MSILSQMLGLPNDEYIPEPKDFHLGIICALAREVDAVEAIFDHIWETEDVLRGKDYNGNESLMLGRIGNHLAALVWIRGIGKTSACLAAKELQSQFPAVKHVMLVGICGGVPFNRNPITNEPFEILLGDAIISTAIHKYDEGKVLERGRDYVAGPQVEPEEGGVFDELLSSIRSRRRYRERKEHFLATETANHLRNIFTVEKYKNMQYPGHQKDKLFKSSHIHKHWDEQKCIQCREAVCAAVDTMTCESLGCKTSFFAQRKRINDMEDNTNPGPNVWFGPIGSADKVVKSGEYRDELSQREKIIGIEMEGAGVCGVFKDFVVIKSVCDYADSHKNKIWQPYAAAVAAACAKALLGLLGSKIPKIDHKTRLLHGSKSQPGIENRKSLVHPRKDPEEVERWTRIYEARGTTKPESLGSSAVVSPDRTDTEQGSTKSSPTTVGIEQPGLDLSPFQFGQYNVDSSLRQTQREPVPISLSDELPSQSPQRNESDIVPTNSPTTERHPHLHRQQFQPNQHQGPNPRPQYPQSLHYLQSHPQQNWCFQPPDHQPPYHPPPYHQPPYHQPPYQLLYSHLPYQTLPYQLPMNGYQGPSGGGYFSQPYDHLHSQQIDQNQQPFYSLTPSQPTSPDPANPPFTQQSYSGSLPNFHMNAQQTYSPAHNPLGPIELSTPPVSPPISKASIDTNATSQGYDSSAQTHTSQLRPGPPSGAALSEQESQEAAPRESEPVFATSAYKHKSADKGTRTPLETESLVQKTVDSSEPVSETSTSPTGEEETATLPSSVGQGIVEGITERMASASETDTLASESLGLAPFPSLAQQSLKEKEDPEQTEALLDACDRQDLKKVQAILTTPSEINIAATNKRGRTMLQLTIGTARVRDTSKSSDVGKIVRALCEAGAEVEKKDKHGLAPIHLCGKYMNPDAAMALLDHGADPNLKDKSGRTALYHIAVDNDPDDKFAGSLIERGGTLAGKRLPDLQERAWDSQIKVRLIISQRRL